METTVPRCKLQNEFEKETGLNWLNSQGEPDIDYVRWLEDKIIIPRAVAKPDAQSVLSDRRRDGCCMSCRSWRYIGNGNGECKKGYGYHEESFYCSDIPKD